MGTISIADALFTKVQQRVLATLFGNPSRSFYANEIIALVGSGTGAVQRELDRLERAGLVTVTRLGKQKHFQANTDAPVYAELRGLVLKTSGVVDVLRAVLEPLADRIRAAFVFGSVARNEDTAASDIDLMIVTDALTYADFYTIIQDAERKLGRQVNPTIYTVAELARRLHDGSVFAVRVLDGPKLWVLGEMSDVAAR